MLRYTLTQPRLSRSGQSSTDGARRSTINLLLSIAPHSGLGTPLPPREDIELRPIGCAVHILSVHAEKSSPFFAYSEG